MSPKSAGLAKKAGYKNINVMLEGEPAWIKAGYPVYASKGFVQNGNIVLIDLRAEEESAKARIPRSVTIPYDTLDDRLMDIPIKAPVVLYSDNKQEALRALEDLRYEGFKNVSLVPGDLASWLQNGAEVASGPVVTAIDWQRKLAEGEVAVEDFQKAVNENVPDVLILDVRTKEEAAEGKYPNSKNIPLDELQKRTDEIPVGKTVYIHCSTGARAEMAYKQLIKNGFKAYFLVADVECDKKNECEIVM